MGYAVLFFFISFIFPLCPSEHDDHQPADDQYIGRSRMFRGRNYSCSTHLTITPLSQLTSFNRQIMRRTLYRSLCVDRSS
ncbi:hypothetical protein RchiOBHm_Chr1g0369231 [Rosa chinensis]|uniref:Secreted protein n=1 Tax=Rosa chinensis TaxID=74649 RepID=A0A2P6SKX9_ROSCH|nr:hypothetical protein RchiOBHm_Chr1g0369231 [Rosa chinensis]